jgi:hypothetical protein
MITSETLHFRTTEVHRLQTKSTSVPEQVTLSRTAELISTSTPVTILFETTAAQERITTSWTERTTSLPEPDPIITSVPITTWFQTTEHISPTRPKQSTKTTVAKQHQSKMKF